MSTSERLKRLTDTSPKKAETTRRSEEIAMLRRRMEAIMTRRQTAGEPDRMPTERRFPRLKDFIPGEECINDAGVCFIQEHRLDVSSSHGRRRIKDIAGIDMQAASFMADDPSLAACLPDEGLFLDTETTGLAGGTGTMAFLIGLGWLDRGCFVVHQILARDFTEERAALTHLARIAQSRRFLVTFNGKTFDAGLLATRYIMNKLPDPLLRMPHLDLLYPSRRLIGHRLENCRLTTLEEQILGVARFNDLPGSEIPRRYFDWLRSGDARLLGDIFDHNRLDVVSLVALTGHLTEMLDYRFSPSQDARDRLALARMCLDRQQLRQAQSILEQLLHIDLIQIRREAHKLLSLLYKRTGRRDDAAALWRRMLEDNPNDLFAAIELAKFYEHHKCDYASALRLAETACEIADNPVVTVDRDALLHRRRRLLKLQAVCNRGE